MNRLPKSIGVSKTVKVAGGVTMPVAQPMQKPTQSQAPNLNPTKDKK